MNAYADIALDNKAQALANSPDTNRLTISPTLAGNNLLASQPEIAKPSVYGQVDKAAEANNTPVTKDILITPAKNELGGSEHQNNEIKSYLGIHY